MHSRSFLVPVSILFFSLILSTARTGSARASYESGASRAGLGPASIQLYGAVAPEAGWFQAGHTTQWGYGLGLQWSLSRRVGLQVDGARFVEPHRSVSPFGIGLMFGPERDRRVRPWFEAGLGYYRFSDPDLIRYALSSGGSARDAFTNSTFPVGSVKSDAWGGYFGFGGDLRLTQRMALNMGVRTDGWSGDGMVRVRSGLSFRF